MSRHRLERRASRSPVPTAPRFGAPLAAALLLVLAFAGAASAATPFVSQTVEGPGSVGTYTTVRMDARDRPNILFYDLAGFQPRYAFADAAGRWSFEVVDAAGSTGTFSSLALDAFGRPHVSYYDAANGDLKYATRRGPDDWLIETVDATGVVGTYTSIALNAAGEPVISYHHDGNDDLKLATRVLGVWSTEIVDATGSTGRYTSLEIGAQGVIHVAYYDVTNADLRYAVKTGGTWTLETVETTGDVGSHASLALDSQGKPGISYLDATNGDLKYASRSAGSWATQVIDGAGFVGQYTSIAMDANGDPHISYHDVTSLDLKHASRSGTTWTLDFVDGVGSVGLHTSIALDSQDNPCIAYFDNSNNDLKFADSGVRLRSPLSGERWASGTSQVVRWSGAGTVALDLSQDGGLTWSTLTSGVTANTIGLTAPLVTTADARLRVRRASPLSTSESPGTFSIAPDLASPWWWEIANELTNVGSTPSLALDARNRPHAAFFEPIGADLRFASRDGAGWDIQAVETAGVTGLEPSLALDALGEPHVSYHLGGGVGDLRYARRSGGVWTTETVDAAGTAGFSSSLALDESGRPHIAYLESDADDLKYARKEGGVWTLETVDSASEVTSECSLALDGRGRPHVAYFNYSGGVADLHYAHRDDAGTWTIEVVHTPGNVGQYPSLALDASGEPRISFYDVTRTALGYASRDAGVWSVEQVDDSGQPGFRSHLQLDSRGDPRIAYTENTHNHLRYASRNGGVWTIEAVDTLGLRASGVSLALDAHGNAHVATTRLGGSDVVYASTAIELVEPGAASLWPVGADREIRWNGRGRVDLSLSVDGGATWQLQQAGLAGGSHRLTVPHAPGRFARFRIDRAVPRSLAVSDLFSIESSVSLLSLAAAPRPDGGAELRWRSDPGPEDLAGYRVERGDASAPGGWRALVPLTRATSHHDPGGGAGTRYRLFAVNGLGESLLLGEVSVAPERPLAAWPQPYRNGDLQVSFGVLGAVGGGPGFADLSLYDVAGRHLRTLASGAFAAGFGRARWDGRDESGRAVRAGVYFLRLRTGQLHHELKLVVLP